jgi:hypothetical protein
MPITHRSLKDQWMRDELILALDPYMREGRTASAGSLAELSALLRGLPIEQELANERTFRNVNSVSLKLYNLNPPIPPRPTPECHETKKKSNATADTTETISAGHTPQKTATGSTASTYRPASADTGTTGCSAQTTPVTAATPAAPTTRPRSGRCQPDPRALTTASAPSHPTARARRARRARLLSADGGTASAPPSQASRTARIACWRAPVATATAHLRPPSAGTARTCQP